MFGIDIGTTQTKMAYVDPTGKPCIINNSRGEPITPSAVYRPASGPSLVGKDAIEQGVVDPRRLAVNFKLLLGGTGNVLQDGAVLTATDATEILIAACKKDAEALLGIAMTEVVATCPANSQDDFKQALLEAFERNAIRVLRLVPEPTAAGVAYAADKSPGRSTIMVYDWGGGTFDVSLVEVDGAQLTVIATEGVQKLGGNDLNEPLKKRVLDDIESKCGERPTPRAEPLLFLELNRNVEAAKISLGRQKKVPIRAGYKGKEVVSEVTQDEFHTAIAPFVQQTLDAVDRAMGAAGLKMRQIDRLIMVGGTSRLPFVQDRVANYTGLVPRTDVDPEKAIAYGAALACISELARQGRTASLRGQMIPSPDLFVRDVTAHDVGCCVVDTSGPRKRMLNAVIIPKNTPIPCRKTDRFYLEHDDQTEAQIEILQGPKDAERDKCLVIGEILLDQLPTETKRTQRIEVEYMIDANGMITATGTDHVSGKQMTVTVDYKHGINRSR